MIVRGKTKVRLLILLASVVLLIGRCDGLRRAERHVADRYRLPRLGMTEYKNGHYANATILLRRYSSR
jgi:hypothetical protein